MGHEDEPLSGPGKAEQAAAVNSAVAPPLPPRLVADTSPAGANFYDYDGAGRWTNHVVHGRTRAFTYDFTGRMTTLTDTNGSVFAYEFDAEGNRLSQALNDCLATRFVHDGSDVLLELNPANTITYAWGNGPGIDQPI